MWPVPCSISEQFPDRGGAFFDRQVETLCQWHRIDPADPTEVSRSHAIQKYQGNDNPFVLDPSLAARTYCN